ncbi:1,3-beta-glucanosyltransferase Gas2 [Schizosaccharomyces cryophilus OY26]|uniref:1,3-beta-glucanosyltransferase n=1 Tax=Schizosaccharomyces cryophilus (strain OY26 / ATCC MYA-4695 / CBS 11777 / NBRC 106824 / NRRL Y48691) TaxID=653667 RepID=S9W0Q7_SCHCR|nr:1,3-beta-glucanosyltransferase Gas2 [Schizosaccharomyces cryophilus OY26]EPY51635.1 1,3-beta-glucanosyltransferase Gas2 [Schizosaccharomyces cryophilus OY26]
MQFLHLALSLLTASTTVFAIEPLTIKGRKFFQNDTQFYVKGVAYQPQVDAEVTSTVIDPLADANNKNCSNDAKLIRSLGGNSIRVYSVNASLDHDYCMEAFKNESIYVFLDVANPSTGIDRANPTWTLTQYDSYKQVIDVFSKYNNTAGFFAGNEVVNNATNAASAAYVRSVVRDLKSYIKSKNYRSIPVGYAGADIPVIRNELAAYLTCNATNTPQDNATEADFLGYNNYEWCGDSNFYASGYAARTNELQNITVPIFFSEFGCNIIHPRIFTEVQAIYSKNMTDVWSGGIVYEFSEEVNGYGLVNITSTGERVKSVDFDNLKKQWATVNPEKVSKHSYQPLGNAPECPARNETSWAVTFEAFPVTPNASLCDDAVKNLRCSVNGDPEGAKIGQVFGELCFYDQEACADITSDPYNGRYGKFSGCTGKQQLSLALDAYTKHHGDDACSWGVYIAKLLLDNISPPRNKTVPPFIDV